MNIHQGGRTRDNSRIECLVGLVPEGATSVEMDGNHAFDTIDRETFNALLNKYPDVVPSKLADLEEQRLVTIPSAVSSRDPKYLTKEELATLMDWKLSHGTSRPSLKKLIQENAEAEIKRITKSDLNDINPKDVPSITSAVKSMCALRGVGPATASLILSTAFPGDVPFFSDELYIWAFWSDEPPRVTWREKKMKYSHQEYSALFTRVQEFRQRMKESDGEDVAALDVEKVAYVLGKQAKGGEGADGVKESNGKGRKRKADDAADEDGNEDHAKEGRNGKTGSGATTSGTGRVTRSKK